jgi:hypothetical protein
MNPYNFFLFPSMNILDDSLKTLIFNFDPTFRDHFKNQILTRLPTHFIKQCFFCDSENHCFRRCQCTIRLMTKNNVTIVECRFTSCLTHIYQSIEQVIKDILVNVIFLNITDIMDVLQQYIHDMKCIRLIDKIVLNTLIYIDEIDMDIPMIKRLQLFMYLQQNILTANFNSYRMYYENESFNSEKYLIPLNDTVISGDTVYPVMLS